MEEKVEKIMLVVTEVLGDGPSPIFMGRMAKTFDEGGKDQKSLCEACVRAEKLVKLFIGIEESKVLGQRFREILEGRA